MPSIPTTSACIRPWFAALALAALVEPGISAQSCINCGDGSNGVFHATVNGTLAGGTYQYTTFTIDPGVTVTVTGDTPLVVRATGAINILGDLRAVGDPGGNGVTFASGGAGGQGVAGGADGGAGVFSSPAGPLNGLPGDGPGAGGEGSGWSGGGGAGYASTGGSSGGVGGFGGPAYGSPSIPVLLGGSGGAGGSGGFDCGAGGGGGGGGGIQLHSCVSIAVAATGSVRADGGTGGTDDAGNCGGGGGASGGSVVLTATTVTVAGFVTSKGGLGGSSNVPGSPYFGVGGVGAAGRIRFDTVSGSATITGTVDPVAVLATCTVPVELQSFSVD